jgi:diacylglycerol kinase (ATP)
MICLANPGARSGCGRKQQNFWRHRLAEAVPDAHWHDCLSGDDCRRQAARADETVVVAAGGDGTINNVINGLMLNEYRPALGVLYCGTSPDFCKFHGLPLESAAAADLLLRGHSKKIDLAEVAFHRGHSGEGRAFFASSCNIGLGAATAEFANQWRKYLGDLAGTGLGLIKAVARQTVFKSEIIIDGRLFSFEKTNHLIVLKNPHIASSLRLDLDCRPDDGLLRVIAIHGYSRLKLLGLIRAMYNGSLLKRENIFAESGRRVEVRTHPTQSLEFDGDPQGQTPAAITVRPQALSLICGEDHD